MVGKRNPSLPGNASAAKQRDNLPSLNLLSAEPSFPCCEVASYATQNSMSYSLGGLQSDGRSASGQR